jgi:hypothetical protein
MKNIKSYIEFLKEANAPTALNILANKEEQKKDINQERKQPETEKDKKFQTNTQKQAKIRTDELDKSVKTIDDRQKQANNRMEDIKLKQDLLPEDPAARKQFIKDTEDDLKNVESELTNAQQQRIALQKQKDRIKNNFIK